jgi:hypothetical protein
MMFTRRIGFSVVAFIGFSAGEAYAGMTVYDLNDVIRLRLQDISFFAFLLVLATLGVRLLWNYLASDFPALPRLTFPKAFGLTALLSILMLLLLIMISGARELLTPGAWYRQGSHYRPNEAASHETRLQSMESLRSALMQYAHAHEGKFPPHEFGPEIPAKLWEAPDSARTRYLYFAGRSLSDSNAPVVCEPRNFGNARLVLLGSGRIESLNTTNIQHLISGSRRE